MKDLIARLNLVKSELYSAVLADTLDGLGHLTSCLPPRVRPLRQGWKVLGRAATLEMVKVDAIPARPYEIEMDCIDRLRSGEVLIITTNGEMESAVWGELLSTACRARGAAGVVLDGLTRDTEKILEMDYPVFAAGYTPLDSKGRLDGVGHGKPIRVGACTVSPGDVVFADIDGVVVVPEHLAEQTFTLALEKVHGENRLRQELAEGKSVREMFAKYGIL